MVYSYLFNPPEFRGDKNKVMRNLLAKTLLEGLIMCVCVGILILFMAMFTPSAAQTKTTTTTYTVVDDAYVVSKSKKTGEVSSKGISASVWDEQVTFNVSPTSVFTVVKRPSGEWVQYGTVKIVERIVEEGIVYFVTSTGKQYSYKL